MAVFSIILIFVGICFFRVGGYLWAMVIFGVAAYIIHSLIVTVQNPLR